MTTTMPQSAGPTFKISHIFIWAAVIGGYFWFITPTQLHPGWEKDFQVAQQQAADSQKPMLLAFYMEGCGPCVAMDRNVLPQKEVTSAIEPFVTVRLDATHERELANRYSVYGTPTYAVVQPNGELVAKCQGYQTTEEFVAFVNRATARLIATRPEVDNRLSDPSTNAP